MKKSAYPPVFDVFPSYKGGCTLEYNGYVWEFLPGHHLQNLWGFVPQHRLVAEDTIGRRLLPGETVHHHDEVKTNNSPDNLGVMKSIEHRRYHAQRMGWACRAKITHDDVVKALDGRSIKNAARLLKVDVQTLRNRYPELLAPRQRASPTKIDNPRDIEIVLAAAPDPLVGLHETAKKAHMTGMTVLRICKRLGIKWVKKSKKGEVRKHYRGKPTLRWLAMNAPGSAPESQ